MRILIFEDADERIEWFKTTYVRAILDITKDADEAIRWLQEHEYYIIFLDHDVELLHYEDLNKPEVWVQSRPGTGYTVATWIAEHKPGVRLVVVHSHNVPGANRMFQALNQANVPTMKVPFLAFKQLYLSVIAGKGWAHDISGTGSVDRETDQGREPDGC